MVKVDVSCESASDESGPRETHVRTISSLTELEDPTVGLNPSTKTRSPTEPLIACIYHAFAVAVEDPTAYGTAAAPASTTPFSFIK